MVTKVSFHTTILNFLFVRLKDSSMVYAPGFEQFSQGFHILPILDVEKKLGAVFLKTITPAGLLVYIYVYMCICLVIVRKPD